MFRVFSPKSRKKKKKDGLMMIKGKKKMAKGAGDDGRLMLKVKIIEGRNLRAADRNKSSDPFVLVSLEGKIQNVYGKKKPKPKVDSQERVYL